MPDKVSSTVYAGRDLKSVAHWGAETPMPDLADAFHTYRLEWRKELIVAVSIDGREVLRMNPEDGPQGGVDPLRESMRLRINLALGGSWGGKIDDAALPHASQGQDLAIKIWSIEP